MTSTAVSPALIPSRIPDDLGSGSQGGAGQEDTAGRAGLLGRAATWALRLRGPVDPDALSRAVQAEADLGPIGRLTIEPPPDPRPTAGPESGQPELAEPEQEAHVLHALQRQADHRSAPWRRLIRLADNRFLLAGHGWPAPDPTGLAVRYAAESSSAAQTTDPAVPDGPGATLTGGEPGSGNSAASPRPAADGQAPDASQFWRQRLSGATRLDLFPDHPRPAHWPYRVALAGHRLPADATAAIRALAQRQGVTERAVLVAGLVAVLNRYTGEEDIAVGAPVPGGGVSVLRVPVSGDPTVEQLLDTSGRAWTELVSHGPVPDSIVQALAAGHPAPCPVSVSFATAQPPASGWAVSGGAVSGGAASGGAASGGSASGGDVRFELLAAGAAELAEDIAVEITPDGDSLRLAVRYAADLFTPGRIARLLLHWERVLRAGATDPALPVSRLPLLDQAERASLVALGNGPTRGYPETTLHALVAERMRRNPQALAAICSGQQLTYGELDRRSALLATHLRELGVGPGSVVAVVLSRGLHTLVAMLGVLRAGAAYTPVDPAFPAERIRFVLEDTAAPVVLTLDGVLDFTPPSGVTVLRLDVDWAQIEATAGDAPHDGDDAGPDSLAYVLFTSGSTGVPKGVLLDHRMIVNYLTWMVDECAIGEQTRMLHCCSPVFDLAVGEIFGALVAGACVVVATHDEVVSPGALAGVIAANRVTHSFTPPTTLSLVDPADCADLRCVLVAGEVVAPELIVRWLDRGARVMNLYGPAEAAVSCTYFDCVPGRFGSSVPIGTVMPNRAARVLDRQGELVPVGVPGELLIAGVGVARGYLNRPELTAERFGTDPYGAGIAYRTGDLARWNANGDLEFLGRLDTQVKLNGLRIELGEIEAVLATHPDVAVAVAAVRSDHGPARLVAYLTGRDGRRPDTVELREHAARVLPPYMVPATFVVVEAFPLGATGKVNRRALPAPAAGRPPLRTPYRAPVTPRELAVAEMMTGVLGVDGIGLDDRVFDLGASSLDVAQLCLRLATVRGEAVPISQVYRLPTVGQLADWLDTHAVAAKPVAAPEVTDGPVPLPPGQANLVEVTERIVCPTTWWIEGDLDTAALVAAVGDLHRRHQALHVRYLDTRPATAIVPDDPGEAELHVLPPALDDAAALAALDTVAQQPLAISAGHVWRSVVVPSLGSGRTLFGFAIHHIAFDGWSQAILVRDLAFAYAARRRGQVPAWPRPAPSLAEVAAEATRCHAVADLAPQRTYWLEQLRTLPRLNIPTMARGPVSEWGPKDGRTFPITAAQVAAWDGYAKGAGVTRFSYLAAVFGQVLRTITGQSDVAMMVPVARRGNALLDRSVGCRLDAVCLRLRPPKGPRTAEPDWLALAAKTVHEAMAAQELPFGEAVAALAAVRPDVHILLTIPTFLLQDYARPGLPLPGCHTELVEDRYAKEVPTPLTVEVFPSGDGFSLRITVRTDRAPVELADRIGAEFLGILAAGPVALAGVPATAPEKR